MKIIAIEKVFCVLLEAEDRGQLPTLTARPESISVVRVFDETTRRTHYAKVGRSVGYDNGYDYLPNGALYLGDTWDEAMKALGVVRECHYR